jgi:hypothetical protein
LVGVVGPIQVDGQWLADSTAALAWAITWALVPLPDELPEDEDPALDVLAEPAAAPDEDDELELPQPTASMQTARVPMAIAR